jgi:L-alanine-DL-glutamate epimerase-like enolase superfamily enzyme
MRVASLETFAVPPRWLLLNLSTDEGLAGWGEPVLEGRAATVAAAVDELSDYLVGTDPFGSRITSRCFGAAAYTATARRLACRRHSRAAQDRRDG